MTSSTMTRSKRIEPQPAEVIDRTRSIPFTFEGKDYEAHPGDTIASALAAAGVKVFSRSFKYHRPRGLMCAAGHCPNCLVQVETEQGSEPSVRACTRPVRAGMKVKAQNTWPSLDRDIMALTALGDRLMPVGFYYKTFIRPQRLWPVYERVLRRVAGLGRIDIQAKAPDGYYKQYLHADVVVVGGGPAGMSAAQEAASQGADVLLLDDNAELGGHARYVSATGLPAEIKALKEMLAELPNLTVLTGSSVLGWWEDHWLSAVADNCLYKIRGKAIIFATGAYEQPLVFENNDLPGVMLGEGAQRLLHLHAVAPGRRAVVVAANDAGWQVALDLQAAGIEVAAVIDERPGGPEAQVGQVSQSGTSIFWQHTIRSADGQGQVERVTIAPIKRDGDVDLAGGQTIPCDLVAISVAYAPANGLLYQAGTQLGYRPEAAEFLPEWLPKNIYATGRLVGQHDLGAQLAHGRQVGAEAAVGLGFGAIPSRGSEEKLPEPMGHSSDRVKVSGSGKRFVCFCEDVTDKDLAMAIAEGYDSIELLKRYSTISMGPCQGKMCSVNTIHLCARANQWTIEETGTTVARPPMTPVSLAALAGQQMEPVKYTPVHDWHLANGAKMMVAGLWMRPEHYGDPLAEIKAVRQGVGLIDVSTLGKIRLTGRGVPNLLERFYVNRWRKLDVGSVRYGLMCNDEGIVMDDGVTARIAENEWYMTTTSSGAAVIYEWIQWWVQSGWGDQVHVTNVSENWSAFNLAGPDSREVLQKLTTADLSNGAFPYMQVRTLELAGVTCRVMRLGFTGELSYEIHCPSGYGLFLWRALVAAGGEFELRPFGVEAQRVLRLEKGHIIIGQDTDALSDPFSADMGWAVKLDKEDFLGQRPLQRISESGPEQRLVGFKMVDATTVPEEGLQIVQANSSAPLGLEIIGWVTSSRWSPTLQEAIGLCWLPTQIAAKEGSRFTIRREGKMLEAEVFHGPFYDRGGKRLRS